ncbi:MAG: glutamate 5-kinase [Caldilineaceae bacterium]|nr:glutamate 5-kinase [Caldilineaceae bacterium]
MSKYRRIVIKLGTSVLTGGERQLDPVRMAELVRQCAQIYHQGTELVICTSGAVTAGRAHLGYPQLPNTVASKQLFAAVGQTRLMLTWERLFDRSDIFVGQILITRADVENRQRYLNARDTFSALLDQRIVPIVNENDAVATEEIKVGDNDNLSALVTTLVNADLLIILTDQPGLFTADPRFHPDAQLIPEVRRIDETLRALAGGTSTGLGVGGMVTKLEAANTARYAGADVVLAAGSERDVILRAVAGEAVGTRFVALETPVESRKRWILAGAKPAGVLRIDAGAVRALCQNGRSLLPAGIVAVQGHFQRGDTVSILGAEREELARGISAYASNDLTVIAGCHSDEIAEKLGFAYGPNAVHRNDMVLLTT